MRNAKISEEELEIFTSEDLNISYELALQRTVAKRNDLIQKGRSSLSLLQRKATEYMFSLVNVNDPVDKIYYFSCREFYETIGRTQAASEMGSFKILKNMVKELADQSVYIDSEDKNYSSLVRMFDRVTTDNRRGGIAFTIHETGRPYLMDLITQMKENNLYYTSYTFSNIAFMKKKYSIQLYSLLKSVSNRKAWKFNIGYYLDEKGNIIFNGTKEYNLYYRLSGVKRDKTYKELPDFPATWKNIGEFKRSVLTPSLKEINELTDLTITYELSKISVEGEVRGTVCAIIFYIKKKNKKKKDNVIESNDYKILDEDNENEDKLEDSCTFNNDIKIEKDESVHNNKSECKYESIYEVVKDLLSPEQTEQLFDVVKDTFFARERIIPEEWARKLWAKCYIEHYYVKLKADKESTTSSFYKRLLNYLINDYDGYAKKISEQHKDILIKDMGVSDIEYFSSNNGWINRNKAAFNEVNIENKESDIPEDIKKIFDDLSEAQKEILISTFKK